jgi:hypothetical protein
VVVLRLVVRTANVYGRNCDFAGGAGSMEEVLERMLAELQKDLDVGAGGLATRVNYHENGWVGILVRRLG